MVGLQWYPPGGSRGVKTSAPFLQDLSSLARRRVSWKAGVKLDDLGGAVEKLRHTYGPLREDDSPVAWLTLAATVRLHVGLNRALSEGGGGALAQAWETPRRELSGRQEPDDEGFKRRKLFAAGHSKDLASRFPDYGLKGVRIVEPSVFTDLDAIEEEELNQLAIIKSWIRQGGAAQNQTRTIRRAVYYGLYDAFRTSLHLHSEQIKFGSRSVGAYCSASTWIFEALSCHWRGGYPVTMCDAEDCHELFPKADKREVFCSPACVERARRHRKR